MHKNKYNAKVKSDEIKLKIIENVAKKYDKIVAETKIEIINLSELIR